MEINNKKIGEAVPLQDDVLISEAASCMRINTYLLNGYYLPIIPQKNCFTFAYSQESPNKALFSKHNGFISLIKMRRRNCAWYSFMSADERHAVLQFTLPSAENKCFFAQFTASIRIEKPKVFWCWWTERSEFGHELRTSMLIKPLLGAWAANISCLYRMCDAAILEQMLTATLPDALVSEQNGINVSGFAWNIVSLDETRIVNN